jgi:hypothetical protein
MTTSLSATHAHGIAADRPYYFPVSVGKLVVMSVCTAGFYNLFWFYCNWRLEEERDRFGDISPFWRTVFSVLFCHSMFERIRNAAERGRLARSHSAGAATLAYILLTAVAPRLPGAWWMLCLASFAPLAVAQRTALAVNARERPDAPRNDRLTALNWLGIVVGGGLVTLAVLGTLTE